MDHKDLKRLTENLAGTIILQRGQAVELVEAFERLEDEPRILPCRVSELQPGDTIIMKYPGRLSEFATDRLKKSIGEIIGKDHRVIVLEEGMDLEIVRKGEL